MPKLSSATYKKDDNENVGEIMRYSVASLSTIASHLGKYDASDRERERELINYDSNSSIPLII